MPHSYQASQRDGNGANGVWRDDADFGHDRRDICWRRKIIERIEDFEVWCVMEDKRFARFREREVGKPFAERSCSIKMYSDPETKAKHDPYLIHSS